MLANKFTQIYRKYLFNCSVSLSGSGSDLSQTSELRLKLPNLIKSLNVGTFLDIPCGDLYWISKTDLNNLTYIGADIVPDLIALNSEKYESASKNFIVLDLSREVSPKVDLIFCRDLFVHLSTRDVKSALQNIAKSKSTYLAMTTFTDC